MSDADTEQISRSGVAPGVAVHVVATTLAGTRDAIAAASVVAQATDSSVYVLARDDGFRTQADCSHESARAIRNLPEACSPRVEVLACFSPRVTDLMGLLPPRAVVFIGGSSRRRWPTAEQRLAREFTRLGCRVVHQEREAACGALGRRAG